MLFLGSRWVEKKLIPYVPLGAEPQAPRPERGSPPRLLRGGKVPRGVSVCEHPSCLQGIKPHPSEAGTAKQSQTPAGRHQPCPPQKRNAFACSRKGRGGFSSPAPGGEHSEPVPSAAPVQHHPALAAQALPFASSSSPSTISRGLLVPARIIAYNYSCWATNSEASLRRIATPRLIPLGNLQLIAAGSEEAAFFHLPTQSPGATRTPSLPGGKLGSWRLPLGRGPPQGTKQCPSKKKNNRGHTRSAVI